MSAPPPSLLSNLVWPLAVAVLTLGLGGSAQFLLWGGAVSERLEQLDRSLGALDARLEGLYPRGEAAVAIHQLVRHIERMTSRLDVLDVRLSVHERDEMSVSSN